MGRPKKLQEYMICQIYSVYAEQQLRVLGYSSTETDVQKILKSLATQEKDAIAIPIIRRK